MSWRVVAFFVIDTHKSINRTNWKNSKLPQTNMKPHVSSWLGLRWGFTALENSHSTPKFWVSLRSSNPQPFSHQVSTKLTVTAQFGVHAVHIGVLCIQHWFQNLATQGKHIARRSNQEQRRDLRCNVVYSYIYLCVKVSEEPPASIFRHSYFRIMEATSSSETLSNIYQTVWRHILEDLILTLQLRCWMFCLLSQTVAPRTAEVWKYILCFVKYVHSQQANSISNTRFRFRFSVLEHVSSEYLATLPVQRPVVAWLINNAWERSERDWGKLRKTSVRISRFEIGISHTRAGAPHSGCPSGGVWWPRQLPVFTGRQTEAREIPFTDALYWET
jgi:hypothetical protein